MTKNTFAPSRRRVLQGLAAIGVDGGMGTKSSDYGVFHRGPGGHRNAKDVPEAG